MQLQIHVGCECPARGTVIARLLLSVCASVPVPRSVRRIVAAMIDAWGSVQALQAPEQCPKRVSRPPWDPMRVCCHLGLLRSHSQCSRTAKCAKGTLSATWAWTHSRTHIHNAVTKNAGEAQHSTEAAIPQHLVEDCGPPLFPAGHDGQLGSRPAPLPRPRVS